MIRRSSIALACLTAMVIGAPIALKAQDSTHSKKLPSMMIHDTLKYGNTVIYDKEVDLADPKNVVLAVHVAINGQDHTFNEISNTVGSAQVGEEDQNHKTIVGYTVSSVVTDITPDGHATAKIVYAVKPDALLPEKTGFVIAIVKFGEAFHKTMRDGTKIDLTVEKQT